MKDVQPLKKSPTYAALVLHPAEGWQYVLSTAPFAFTKDIGRAEPFYSQAEALQAGEKAGYPRFTYEEKPNPDLDD